MGGSGSGRNYHSGKNTTDYYPSAGTTMGGYGSGRRSWSRNMTCDYPRLDVRTLYRNSLLTVGCSVGFTCSRNGEAFATIDLRRETNRVVLIYRHSDDHGKYWQNEECPVMLEWTRCNYGGKRVLFVQHERVADV